MESNHPSHKTSDLQSDLLPLTVYTPIVKELWYHLESNQGGQIFNLLLYLLSYGAIKKRTRSFQTGLRVMTWYYIISVHGTASCARQPERTITET